MSGDNLQKPALQSYAEDLPVEVLDPVHSAQYYSLVMPKPSEKLSRFVDHYWVMRWDVPGSQSFIAEVIPSAYINLTCMPEGAKVTGVTTGKYTYEVSGKGVIVGAKFLPGGYYAFTSQSAHLVTDKAVPAQQMFSRLSDEVNMKAIHAPSDSEAERVLEKVLLECDPTWNRSIKLVQTIIKDIKKNDVVSVASVAEKYRLSERRLQELFRRYVGVSPKWVMLRYRLIKATHAAVSQHMQNWTEIAHELGYSDQSHFVNDFKRIIGKTPKQYAASVHDKVKTDKG
jgi:AraC-like DNA-binding protein